MRRPPGPRGHWKDSTLHVEGGVFGAERAEIQLTVSAAFPGRKRGRCGCGGCCGPVHTAPIPPPAPARGGRLLSLPSPLCPRRPEATGQVSHMKSHLCEQQGGQPAGCPHGDALSSGATHPSPVRPADTLSDPQHPPLGGSFSGWCKALAQGAKPGHPQHSAGDGESGETQAEHAQWRGATAADGAQHHRPPPRGPPGKHGVLVLRL